MISQIRKTCEGLKDNPDSFASLYREAGLFGASIPEEYNGGNLPLQDILDIVSFISQTGLSGPAMLGSHLRVCHYVTNFGTIEQKAKYLPKLASGKYLAAHARTEHNSPVKARMDEEGFVLDGIKPYVTNARDAKLIAVTANNNKDIFLVERDNPNLIIGEDIPRIGVLDTSLCRVHLDGCYVQNNALLGGNKNCGQQFLSETKVLALMTYTARACGALHGLKSLLMESPPKTLPNREGVSRNIDERIITVEAFLAQAVTKFDNDDSSLPEYIASARAQSAQFCMETLSEMQSSYMYTHKTFARLYCDIPALAIIGGRK